jgi:hypothetical protein
MNMDFEVLIIRIIQVDNMCGRLLSSAIRESHYAMKIGEFSFETNAMGCFGRFSVLHLMRVKAIWCEMRCSSANE